ncbi:hypothetical protein [Streptomyces sp. NPDC005805]|uniref:hypothetical protein n=1 Tax=Streptomyces sp. NPDC005805 TaxID=3157068 RepID=UPI0033C65E13
MKSRILPIALATLVVSGCGMIGGGEKEPKGKANNVDMQQAADLVEEILNGTLAAIKPKVETKRGLSSTPLCTDFKNDSTGTGQVKRGRNVLTIISAERRGSFVGVVERYWKGEGYEITSVRPNKEKPAVFARTPEGFQLSLDFGREGQAFFNVSSPCVTESDVTEPSKTPIAPDSPEAKGLPYITSTFWSSDTPVPSPPAEGN